MATSGGDPGNLESGLKPIYQQHRFNPTGTSEMIEFALQQKCTHEILSP